MPACRFSAGAGPLAFAFLRDLAPRAASLRREVPRPGPARPAEATPAVFRPPPRRLFSALFCLGMRPRRTGAGPRGSGRRLDLAPLLEAGDRALDLVHRAAVVFQDIPL